MRIVHQLTQGSDPWHQFRLNHHGASEAAAMLGLSKKTTRNELLRMKHGGIAREFSEWVQRHILDRGHEVEKLAIRHVEEMLDDTLYPVTCSDGKLSASCDGLTLGGEIAWEHKQFAAELFATVAAGRVPDEHMPQCQQVLMVTGAEKLIFTVSDGTPERMAHAEVLPDPAWFERLRAGWAQFERDLADYVPPAAAPVVVAAPVQALPMPAVRMDGALTVVSNLDRFGTALRAFVERIPAKPTTDQEFADTDAACKALKNAEDALESAESTALASISCVEEMRRVVADLRNLARTTRLASEKLVERRKTEIKDEIIRKARDAFAEHVRVLNSECQQLLAPPFPDFAGAAKGKRTLATLQDAVDVALANGKIAADAAARDVRAKLAHLQQAAADYLFLFADKAVLVQKPMDDFALIVQARIDGHRLAEAEAAARTAAAPPPAPTVAVARPAVATQRQAANEPPTLKLGTICDRLGFTVSAAFLADTLGLPPAATDKAAKLYRESDWPRICAALVLHIQGIAQVKEAA
jgi:predicted phage-related endonuclease